MRVPKAYEPERCDRPCQNCGRWVLWSHTGSECEYESRPHLCKDDCEQHRVDLISYRDRLAARGFLFRPTTDYWAPNFPVDLVAIRCGQLHTGEWDIYITGADDDLWSIVRPTREEIMRIYRKIPLVITKAALRDLARTYE